MIYAPRKKHPSTPRQARGGIKARSASMERARNWWAQRWLKALEKIMDSARLQRGQHYALKGQVLSVEERNGEVISTVQGSRPKPYRVSVRLSHFSDRQWEKVLKALSQQAIYAAQLLAGEMPENIEEVFASAGVSLFPAHSYDLVTECSCPDWANPCKHIAATHYILGDRFDEDPFLILRLRGRTQKQVLDGLRRHRGDAPVADDEDERQPVVPSLVENSSPGPTLDNQTSLEHFWELGSSAQDFSISVKPPEIPLPIFRRLGEPDIPKPKPLETLLAEVYNITNQAAMIIAYHGVENGGTEE